MADTRKDQLANAADRAGKVLYDGWFDDDRVPAPAWHTLSDSSRATITAIAVRVAKAYSAWVQMNAAYSDDSTD